MGKLFMLVVNLALSVMLLYFLLTRDLVNFIYVFGILTLSEIHSLKDNTIGSTSIIIYGDPSEEELENSLDEVFGEKDE